MTITDTNGIDKNGIEKSREQLKAAQQSALAAFSKVQFAMMSAYSNQWSTYHTRILEDAISELAQEVKAAKSAEASIVVAMAGLSGSGPAPADLTTVW